MTSASTLAVGSPGFLPLISVCAPTCDTSRASGTTIRPIRSTRSTSEHSTTGARRLERCSGKLSPVLLVVGKPLIIADGYHRVCALHALSEDLDIPCRLVSPQLCYPLDSCSSPRTTITCS